MKSTERFKIVIQDKLEEMAKNDNLFAISYKKENKNIDDCIKYILNTVKKSGCMGFEDDEVFGMATHYYDEDELDLGGDIKCKVVLNHTVELTNEEIAQARKEAFNKEVEEQRKMLRKKSVKKTESVTQNSLF